MPRTYALVVLIGSLLFIVPAAHAQTVSSASSVSTTQLQAQVTALEAQVAAKNTTSTVSTGSTLTQTLSVGASGAAVTNLQMLLISKGYSIPSGASGYYGAQTKKAVKEFQTANNISPVTGSVGPITLARLNASIGISTGTTPGTSSSVTTTVTSMPGVGCASGALFSSTTGQSCGGNNNGGNNGGNNFNATTTTLFSATDSVDNQMAEINSLLSGVSGDVSQLSTSIQNGSNNE